MIYVFGYGAIVLILSALVVTAASDDASGIRRENMRVLAAVLVTLGIVFIVACTAVAPAPQE